MCGSVVDIQSLTAEIRRGKKEEDRNHRAKIYWPALFHRTAIKKKPQDKNIVSASATQGGRNKIALSDSMLMVLIASERL